VKLNGFGKAFGATVSAAAIVVFSATGCGSDTNSSSNSSGAGAANCGGKKALTASGSTAQQNAMTRFVKAYEAACSGYTVNYSPKGSGPGVNEFIGNQTDFAGSDVPLDPAKGEVDKAKQRCGGNDAWDLPTVFGPIAIAYNLPGVDGLALDGPTLAKIFNGTVTTWNAPEIAALNNGKSLPSDPIVVFFRSEDSGTTDNFQHYLDAVPNGAWGKGTGKKWNGVGEGKKGSDGVAAAVKGTPNSISYAEWSFAKPLQVASVVTSAGPAPVQLTADTAGKSIAGVGIKGQGHDLVLDTSSIYNPKDAGAYPIVLATYEIVCSKYPDSQAAPAVKAFLTAALGKGQDGLADAGYVPIPDAFKSKLTDAVNAIS
jgi:phosphate transport system substrate-binding protein